MGILLTMKLLKSIIVASAFANTSTNSEKHCQGQRCGCNQEEMLLWKNEMKNWKHDQESKLFRSTLLNRTFRMFSPYQRENYWKSLTYVIYVIVMTKFFKSGDLNLIDGKNKILAKKYLMIHLQLRQSVKKKEMTR